MTRLANIEKAGYFPLPPSVTQLIQTHIMAPHGGRILDPCAGEGAALVTLADTFNLELFGVELHEGRAQKARELTHKLLAKRLTESRSTLLSSQTRILHDSYLSLKTSRDGYNLLYLNPPYDHDHEDGDDRGSRLEYQFLWRTRPYLQSGGLLIYVIPQHILKMRKLAQYVVSHFQDIRVYRFPDGTYERFKQIVLFGVRRTKALAPDPEAVESLRTLGQGNTLLPTQQQLSPLTAVS